MSDTPGQRALTRANDGFPAPPPDHRSIMNINTKGAARLLAAGLSMEKLANMLTNQLNRPVHDATNLKEDCTIFRPLLAAQ